MGLTVSSSLVVDDVDQSLAAAVEQVVEYSSQSCISIAQTKPFRLCSDLLNDTRLVLVAWSSARCYKAIRRSVDRGACMSTVRCANTRIVDSIVTDSVIDCNKAADVAPAKATVFYSTRDKAGGQNSACQQMPLSTTLTSVKRSTVGMPVLETSGHVGVSRTGERRDELCVRSDATRYSQRRIQKSTRTAEKLKKNANSTEKQTQKQNRHT